MKIKKCNELNESSKEPKIIKTINLDFEKKINNSINLNDCYLNKNKYLFLLEKEKRLIELGLYTEDMFDMIIENCDLIVNYTLKQDYDNNGLFESLMSINSITGYIEMRIYDPRDEERIAKYTIEDLSNLFNIIYKKVNIDRFNDLDFEFPNTTTNNDLLIHFSE